MNAMLRTRVVSVRLRRAVSDVRARCRSRRYRRFRRSEFVQFVRRNRQNRTKRNIRATTSSLNFAASDVLLKQIEQGAPADVFASADEITMDRAAQSERHRPSTRKDFAANTLVLIVGVGATCRHGSQDIAGGDYTHIAIGNPDSVPAGRYAKEALTSAKLWDKLQPQIVPTQNVRQALDYVARGEAQAGFVYATDAETQKEKVHVAMTVPTSTPVRYPIAVTANRSMPTCARISPISSSPRKASAS